MVIYIDYNSDVGSTLKKSYFLIYRAWEKTHNLQNTHFQDAEIDDEYLDEIEEEEEEAAPQFKNREPIRETEATTSLSSDSSQSQAEQEHNND
jgi:hypothetical protein